MSNTLDILLGKGDKQVRLPARYANRHGMIAGATGTGKTVSLQVLAEGFSRIGVPVFMADVKGDLAGVAMAGSPHEKVQQRVDHIGIEHFEFNDNPVTFWDIDGQSGHPVRATIADMGPTLLSRLMELNETQEGVLTMAFRFADDHQLLMLDLKDLKATLRFMADHRALFAEEYGNVSSASIGAIQRRLLVLEEQGAADFFGEPELDLHDLMRTRYDGRGYINILDARSLMARPKLYATLLLWLLSELFEELPEAGDLDKPKFVFFFDEAHLLFDDAPKALVDKIETVVKLIRSKGIGIWFISQNPLDIPDAVLGQLGNRVQHALRAFTPKDQKAVRVAASTLRPNPNFDAEQAITELGVGEALVSVLEKDGVPSIVERTLMSPPRSRIGPISDHERNTIIAASPVAGVYDDVLDRESAFEKLEARRQQQAAEDIRQAAEQAAAQQREAELKAAAKQSRGSGRKRQTIAEAAAKSFVRSISSRLATQVVRGILGSTRRR